MDKDCDRARSKYIHKSMDIMEDLNFAYPYQKLNAVH